MNALRSILFNLGFWIYTAALGLVALPLFVLPSNRILFIHRWWATGSAWLVRNVLALDCRIEGLENLPDGACILASKHMSAWETILFGHLFWPVRFVMKRELAWIPLFGWGLVATGQIIIDRKGGTKAMRQLIKEGKRAQADGVRIPIFPEGTRVRPGAQPPLQPGVVALARHLGLPVVPVALNSGLFWERSSFWKRSGTIRVKVFPPLAADLGKAEMLETLHRLINSPLAEG